MRLWHFKLLPYLPDDLVREQWRVCCAIASNIERHGTPNHLLVNKITEYPLNEDFCWYCARVAMEMMGRGFSISGQAKSNLKRICEFEINYKTTHRLIFKGWHEPEYLEVCMFNLYERHVFGVGKSRISDKEWQVLLDGYMHIARHKFRAVVIEREVRAIE